MKDDYPVNGDESQKFDWYYKEQWFDEFFMPLGFGLILFAFVFVLALALSYCSVN